MKPFHLFRTLAGAIVALALFSSPLLARQHKADTDKKEALYPNATREAPKLDLTSEKDQKAINEGLDAVGAGDKAKAEQVLGPIAEGSKSKYAQALALQGLANLKYNDGDVKGAIATLQKSLAIGVMRLTSIGKVLQGRADSASEPRCPTRTAAMSRSSTSTMTR